MRSNDSEGQVDSAGPPPAQELVLDPIPVLHTARCECRNCGVHTMASVGYKVAGTCPNCGSFDMVPVV